MTETQAAPITARFKQAQWEVQRAETALADANEDGDVNRIQRAETRLSNATERLERLYIYRGNDD